MIPFVYDPGLPFVAAALWIGLAALARMAAGSVIAHAVSYDWTSPVALFRSVFSMPSDGQRRQNPEWTPRHVADSERGRHVIARLDVHDIGDGTAYRDELHEIVEQIRAEESGDAAPLPLTGGLSPETIAALQENTAVLPVLDLHAIFAARATAAEFDELVGREFERELFYEARARLERTVTAPTGEFPTIPRQRQAVEA